MSYFACPDVGAGLGLVVLADDHRLCDRFAAEGFTVVTADDDIDAAVERLLASEVVRGDGVGVLAFDASATAIDRPDVQAIVVVDPTAVEDEERPVQVHETFDDLAWTRTLEFLRAKLG
jgi:NAD(P)-dependent dehydrogenase (short-subunit alcohol dehydrogenase family)